MDETISTDETLGGWKTQWKEHTKVIDLEPLPSVDFGIFEPGDAPTQINSTLDLEVLFDIQSHQHGIDILNLTPQEANKLASILIHWAGPNE